MTGWIGKLGGGLVGFITGGYVGAAIGALLGHQLDRGLAGETGAGDPGLSGNERQRIFFQSTFLVMGHVAKADGRVSEEEIRSARAVMHRMRLRPEDVRRAIALFSRGKQPDFNVDEQLRSLRRACGHQPDLVQAFLEIQMDLALSTGSMQARERELLWRIAGALGVSRVELAQLEAVIRAQRTFGQRMNRGGADEELKAAYRALSIEATASDRDVKLAYRRLMNQHHPDKLVARGLPDEMLEVAKERTSEISKAYEVIKTRRGLK
ncbi:MAG: co-chaperone DjlA [Gammaproteobacteria bacterium]